MPRLFTGLEIPAAAGLALSLLRGGLPGARWIDPENYHVTLRFIGDVDARTARDITQLLADGSGTPFTLRFNGLGSFGGRKPRAVYAGIVPDESLLGLQGEHERMLRRLGLPPEARKYAPHVTLARLRDTSSHEVADYLSTRGAFGVPPVPVSRFVLFSSRDGVGGGPYVVEAAYPLET